MCDANEALADHPASDLHDTQGCVVTCAAWNVSDCTAPTYVGTVTDRRCEETVRLDKIGAGRYESFGHHWWHGGNHTMDFMDCVAAVRAHAGQDGCRGEFFYWEDWGSRGGTTAAASPAIARLGIIGGIGRSSAWGARAPLRSNLISERARRAGATSAPIGGRTVARRKIGASPAGVA